MSKRKISAMNNRIINLASDVADAVVAEAEEVLEDAEKVIKEFVPARFVNKTLASIETKLEKEGIEALFDKTVTRQALKATASEEVTAEELDELIDEIISAIVEELEEVLKDADEVMDEETSKITASEDTEDDLEIERKLKSIVERKLHAKGIYSRFARTASSKKKVSIADKIRAARKK